MNIIITGAGGFIGQALASSVSKDPLVSKLTITDIVEPTLPPQQDDSKAKVHSIKADLTSREICQSLFTPDLTHVYLLHGLMSGASEANLDLGLKINVDSMRQILDILREVNRGVKVIFPSSCAVFGPSHGQVVTEQTMPQPGSSYGSQKWITEILLNDFSRRGLLDGRILRLPTIIVRPGAPSGAASSFCSGIIREPLKDERSVLPIARKFEIWVCSTRTIIKNLIHARDIDDGEFIDARSRVINLPGITVTSEQMLEALRKVGGDKAVSLVEEKRDPVIEKIVYSWPFRFDTSYAAKLGFSPNGTLEQTLREYIEDYGIQ